MSSDKPFTWFALAAHLNILAMHDLTPAHYRSAGGARSCSATKQTVMRCSPGSLVTPCASALCLARREASVPSHRKGYTSALRASFSMSLLRYASKPKRQDGATA